MKALSVHLPYLIRVRTRPVPIVEYKIKISLVRAYAREIAAASDRDSSHHFSLIVLTCLVRRTVVLPVGAWSPETNLLFSW